EPVVLGVGEGGGVEDVVFVVRAREHLAQLRGARGDRWIDRRHRPAAIPEARITRLRPEPFASYNARSARLISSSGCASSAPRADATRAATVIWICVSPPRK